MKFVLFIIIVVMFGCSNSVKNVPAPNVPAPNVVNPPNAGLSDIVVRPGWRIEIPHTWKNKKVLTGYVATSPEDPPMIVSINFQSLSGDMKDNEFGATALLGTLMIDNVEVLNSAPYSIAGYPGIVALVKVDSLILLQYMVGAYGRGYVVSCGAIARQDIVPTCKSILDTFTPVK